ncbi:polyamine transporter 1 [Histoplasma capsulatum G186AR]|uniref:Polyamine transporter 1 n=1 Tax=Ajellomyces capsulatus (strain G186AR / H82 / ATCC MYA-2454 / RMSCC 2432) TaxID=447093 RepID=C0NFP6_AJECG|nr:polyamine transporter 1 [Histoplasma capsulatum G186AR]EEH10067.1 polyamine transporter 1 [Histoplasma capsulatum G186AR]
MGLARTQSPSKDPNLVTWSGPEDPENPLNWSRPAKWAAVLIVSSFTFISPVSSTMVAPALAAIGKEFGITSSMEQVLVMSIFLLAYAVGPFLLGPLSEIFGRVAVLQLANLFYLVFNTACGFAQNKQQILAFRFLSGLGGSAPQALGGGVISDCWRAEERGKSIAIYSLAPFIGPAVGPIEKETPSKKACTKLTTRKAGGFMAKHTTWRWIFWSVSIADAGVQAVAFVFLKETYAPKLLANKAKKLRRSTGNNALRTKWEMENRSFGMLLRKSLVRPFIMLGTQPTIQALALYRAYLYGLMYLVLSSFPLVWEGVYKQTTDIASLNYLSLGIGFVIGLQICAPIMDRIYIRLKAHYNHPGRPEFRIPLMIPGGLLVPIGLMTYGWTAQPHIHWIIPSIASAIFATGLIIGFQCAQAYIVDAYTQYAASATGAAAFLRTLAGFSFPLFAPSLYARLGLGWGNALLAFISAGMGIVAPALLWRYGEFLRGKSTYCAG